MAYALGSAGKSGASAVGSGMAAVGDAAAGAATSPLRKAGDSMMESFREGSRAAITNTGGFWSDDAAVAWISTRKLYAGPGCPTGCMIQIKPATP